jgi:aminotransferase in exopolysaccharide biosynthesis
MQLDLKILEVLKNTLGEGTHLLHEPRFEGNEIKYTKECIDSTFVSSVGKFVDKFEISLAEFTGARRAIAVVNGTAALQVALKVGGVNKNDEVIMPSLTFVATANATRYVGAEPHFIDIEERTLGVDVVALTDWLKYISEPSLGGFRNKYTGKKLKALVPMHTFGHPCDMEGILSIAKDYNLVLIEDAAESLGSFYQGKHTGTFGKLGTLSFNGNKIITTGGGGAILTDDEKLADYAKHITTTAKKPHPWNYIHDEVGYNFRLPNLNAALGCAQLENLPYFLKSKRLLTNKYIDAFKDVSNLRIMKEVDNCESNYWLQTIILDKMFSSKRDIILKTTNNAGIMTRPIWEPLHKLEPYKKCYKAPLEISTSLSQRIINIPSSAGLVN